uniref:Putative cell wall invertase n=1 Tax=Asparagus officinalis TaxID=4686 RepID=A9E2W4_ASPOF|nr:putative cell wall invertase [Asparagus officinalis]
MASIFPGLGWILGFSFICSSLFEIYRRHLLYQDPIAKNFIASELYRTAYHFQPTQHWMNDPNAPMYYNGVYHLFYQHNPDAATWTANISWGHSVSADLVHWTGLELALTPSDPFDISGCWSGSATILPGSKPVILYTGLDTVSRQVQNIAYPKNLSDPFLREWIKPRYNPVIEPHGRIDAALFRDPSTAWLGRDGSWRLTVGTVIDGNGLAMLYKSKDFVKWVPAENPLYYTNGSGMWECVDFFPLGEARGVTKYMLKVSMFDVSYDYYALGTYDEEGGVFTRDDASSTDYRTWPMIDYGRVYASKTFLDEAKQRRILWGWSNESNSIADDVAKGWAGIQTVPRVLSLDTDGKRLVQWPIEELESLRGEQIHLQDIELETGSQVEVRGLKVSQADVEVEFELQSLIGAEPFDANWIVDPPKLCREKGAYANHGGIGPFGLLVLAADNLEENTAVYFRVFRAEGSYKVLMCADQRRSSKRSELYKPASGGFVDIDIKKERKISLRTLIDHSVVESFGGGGRTCITSRVYPTILLNDNTHLYAFNYGTETVKISELKAWNMAQAQIS